MTDRNDFLINGSDFETRVKSPVGPAVGDREYLKRLSAANGESTLCAYIERQDRNEFTNLASQIGCEDSNIDFVFYTNQIRRLMHESPYDECRLEVLRASCIGHPREMVNLFFAPMKNMSTSKRIESALNRLRQRYGVSGGLTCCCCCWLPDPFRGMGAWRNTMEPQKPGNSPRSGPEVVQRQRVAKE